MIDYLKEYQNAAEDEKPPAVTGGKNIMPVATKDLQIGKKIDAEILEKFARKYPKLVNYMLRGDQ